MTSTALPSAPGSRSDEMQVARSRTDTIIGLSTKVVQGSPNTPRICLINGKSLPLVPLLRFLSFSGLPPILIRQRSSRYPPGRISASLSLPHPPHHSHSASVPRLASAQSSRARRWQPPQLMRHQLDSCRLPLLSLRFEQHFPCFCFVFSISLLQTVSH